MKNNEKIGFILGKFMPLTIGHIGLIEWSLQFCDELIVAVCTLNSSCKKDGTLYLEEPIDGQLRYEWVKEYFRNNEKIKVEWITEDLPNKSESDREVSKLWAKYLKVKYPEIDIMFASEQYAEYVAEYMNIEYKIYDIPRENIPISATMIRENPFKYWDFIPNNVKPYFVKKVCIYGSDSVGKSSLTLKLGNHYKTAIVPEMARNLINYGKLDIDNLNINHLEQFAKIQSETVKSMTYFADKLLFCDSDNLTTQIYSEVYCNEVTDKIKMYDNIHYDLYIFLDIDTIYRTEGQRNLGNRRVEMFNRFKQKLEEKNVPYVFINGSWEERLNKAIKSIDKILLDK